MRFQPGRGSFVFSSVLMTMMACGSPVHTFDLRSGKPTLGSDSGLALSEGGHDFVVPTESTRFTPNYRLSYLGRADSAVAYVKANCPAAKSKCDQVVPQGSKSTRVVYFREAIAYDIPAGDCFNITDTTPDMLVIEGQGLGTRLTWSGGATKCNGSAIQSTQDTRETTIVVRKVTIEGQYEPWDGVQPKRTPKKHPLDASGDFCQSGSPCDKWQKAILVRGSRNHVHVDRAEIKGFYYALTAEQKATGYAYDVVGRKAGDAVFFAYEGGQLRLEKTEASDAADVSRGLGFGYVAESLTKGEGGYALCNAQVAANAAAGVYPTAEAREASRDSCIMHLSYYLSMSERSLITAIDSFAHENLKGGFLANSGAVIVANGAKAFAHRESPPLLDTTTNPPKPNVYGPGYKPTGFGFNARHMAKILAANALAYENYIGFEAHDDATMDVRYSKAWSNEFYGYHAVRYGRINGDHSQSFGPKQKWGYATERDTSSIDVTAIWVKKPPTPENPAGVSPPSFCVWSSVSPCTHWVVPDYHLVDNYNMPLVQGNPGMGLFYRP